MKLNLSQWNPATKTAIPENDAFYFTHDLERMLKEFFNDFRECALGLASEKELFKWQSFKWEPLKFVDHFEGDKNPEVRNVLRRAGCHIDENGFVRFRHYFLVYVPKWVVEQRAKRREQVRKSQLNSQADEQSDKLSRALQSDVTASIETWDEKIEAGALAEAEEKRRGPGRPRKEP